jgi:hypothetical protein
LYELICLAPMYFFCVALIISIVHLCPMLLYKISKSHANFFLAICRPPPFITAGGSKFDQFIDKTYQLIGTINQTRRKPFPFDKIQKSNYGPKIGRFCLILRFLLNRSRAIFRSKLIFQSLVLPPLKRDVPTHPF